MITEIKSLQVTVSFQLYFWLQEMMTSEFESTFGPLKLSGDIASPMMPYPRVPVNMGHFGAKASVIVFVVQWGYSLSLWRTESKTISETMENYSVYNYSQNIFYNCKVIILFFFFHQTKKLLFFRTLKISLV